MNKHTQVVDVDDSARIIERPDGFYWHDEQTGEEVGPYPSLIAAIEGRLGEDDEVADVASLMEAESEMGISDWMDPDSGLPLEDGVASHDEH